MTEWYASFVQSESWVIDSMTYAKIYCKIKSSLIISDQLLSIIYRLKRQYWTAIRKLKLSLLKQRLDIY